MKKKERKKKEEKSTKIKFYKKCVWFDDSRLPGTLEQSWCNGATLTVRADQTR